MNNPLITRKYEDALEWAMGVVDLSATYAELVQITIAKELLKLLPKRVELQDADIDEDCK